MTEELQEVALEQKAWEEKAKRKRKQEAEQKSRDTGRSNGYSLKFVTANRTSGGPMVEFMQGLEADVVMGQETHQGIE